MKLTVIMVLIAIFQVNAGSFAQKVSLSEKNVPLIKIFDQISAQTGYDFLASRKLLRNSKPVSIHVENEELVYALEMIFKGQHLEFSINDRAIVVTEKEGPAVDKKANYLALMNIKGYILDESNQPLPGASIMIKGTKVGVVSDKNGAFSINNVPDDAVLIISFVGYRSMEVSAKADLSAIQLALNGSELNEFVVVGYGTQKKISLTGAVAAIHTKEIKQSPAANLAVTLAGRLPGLTAIQKSGEPGNDAAALFIRGQGTTNTQNPIILVDGIERDLTYVDPNEIASITILKDASSTAIFGVRGANGVILVTTLRGTSEIPEINFTAESGMQQFTRFITPVSSFDYATLRNLAQKNDGLPLSFSDATLEHYRTGDDPLRYPNTNWRDLLVKPFSTQSRSNLNVSGAGTMTKYFVNVGYLNQGGQFKTEKDQGYNPEYKLDRYNFRSNIDIQLTKDLKAFLNVAGYLEKINRPYGLNSSNGRTTGTLLQYMNDLPATIPGPLAPNGEVLTSTAVEHPAYGQLNRSGYINQSRSNITASYGMEHDLSFIAKGLSAKAMISFDTKSTNDLMAWRDYERYTQVIDPNLKGADGQDSVYYTPFGAHLNTPLEINGGRNYTTLSNFQGYLNYSRVINDHSLTGLFLLQQQKTVINNELPYNLKGIATRLGYSYKNRYFAEFNAGYNGSEQFAQGKRYGFFPSFSGAWVLSNEHFLSSSTVISLLKLRASYGQVGNDRIGSRRFLYLDDIQVEGGGYSTSLGNGQRINTRLLGNKELQWEVSNKLNAGLELSLWNNDLSMIFDVFKERRNNILMSQENVPAYNGVLVDVLPPLNIGEVQNNGFEAEFTYKKTLRKDFSILSRLNFSYARNEFIRSNSVELPAQYAYRSRDVGYRIGQPFAYVVSGYFSDEADVLNSPVQSVGGRASKPGDFKYVDMNHDGVINDFDRAPIGYSNVPEVTYGWAFNINFKKFDLSVLLQGVTNVSEYYNGRGVFASNGGVNNYTDIHMNSWTPERVANGDKIDYPRLTTQESPNEIYNSFFVTDASYLRLKNVEVGYSIPEHIAAKIKAKRIRFYANGLNLVTWDNLPTKNFDPELTGSLNYPNLRIYNFGVNVLF